MPVMSGQFVNLSYITQAYNWFQKDISKGFFYYTNVNVISVSICTQYFAGSESQNEKKKTLT